MDHNSRAVYRWNQRVACGGQKQCRQAGEHHYAYDLFRDRPQDCRTGAERGKSSRLRAISARASIRVPFWAFRERVLQKKP